MRRPPHEPPRDRAERDEVRAQLGIRGQAAPDCDQPEGERKGRRGQQEDAPVVQPRKPREDGVGGVRRFVLHRLHLADRGAHQEDKRRQHKEGGRDRRESLHASSQRWFLRGEVGVEACRDGTRDDVEERVDPGPLLLDQRPELLLVPAALSPGIEANEDPVSHRAPQTVASRREGRHGQEPEGNRMPSKLLTGSVIIPSWDRSHIK